MGRNSCPPPASTLVKTNKPRPGAPLGRRPEFDPTSAAFSRPSYLGCIRGFEKAAWRSLGHPAPCRRSMTLARPRREIFPMTAAFLSGIPSPSQDPRYHEGPDAVSFSRHARQSPPGGSNESSGSSFGAGLDPGGSVASAGSAEATSSRSGGRGHGRSRSRAKPGTRKRSSGRRTRARAEGPSSADRPEEAGEAGEPTRRSRRRRRPRSKKVTASAAEPTGTGAPSDELDAGSEAAPRKKRRRGTRGGRRHARKVDTAVEIEAIPGEDDELPVIADLPDAAGSGAAPSRGGKKKATKSRRRTSRSDRSEEKTRKAKRSRRRGSPGREEIGRASCRERV